ncbi:hypothetical protein QBC40DRAFT_263395 [Triangularia verruculosa]|uniref:Uncharacterized protein n=1 Tax=Triangularia verruculosa TaxID=2587418 RepID=A0AAN7AXQ5_9PEZI|nr:hypothetical protein QBC40DRAFT_263395 [Triangularia verruculosa]
MRFIISLSALALALTTAAAPAPIPQDQPLCVQLPEAFWTCVSDCLYKICPDAPDVARCNKGCDAKCKAIYAPDCEPGPH